MRLSEGGVESQGRVVEEVQGNTVAVGLDNTDVAGMLHSSTMKEYIPRASTYHTTLVR